MSPFRKREATLVVHFRVVPTLLAVLLVILSYVVAMYAIFETNKVSCERSNTIRVVVRARGAQVPLLQCGGIFPDNP